MKPLQHMGDYTFLEKEQYFLWAENEAGSE